VFTQITDTDNQRPECSQTFIFAETKDEATRVTVTYTVHVHFSPSPVHMLPHARPGKTYIQSVSGRVWNHAGMRVVQMKPADAVSATTTDGGRPDGVPTINSSSENTHPLTALRNRHQRTTDSGFLCSWHHRQHMVLLWQPRRSSYYNQEKASGIVDRCLRAAQHQYPRGLHWTFWHVRQPAFFSWCDRQDSHTYNTADKVIVCQASVLLVKFMTTERNILNTWNACHLVNII
jgi:hypothetical protein